MCFFCPSHPCWFFFFFFMIIIVICSPFERCFIDFIHSLIHSFIRSLIHSFTHSFIPFSVVCYIIVVTDDAQVHFMARSNASDSTTRSYMYILYDVYFNIDRMRFGVSPSLSTLRLQHICNVRTVQCAYVPSPLLYQKGE